MSNEVFAAMFFGNLPEKEQVIITDIHPDGFASMLRYFYGGRLRFRTVDEALYTSTAAEKYMIPDLKRICSEYIVSHVNARNVCRLVDYASISDGGHVHEAVVSILENNAVAVVSSDSFIDALQSTIEYVLMNIRGVPESCVARGLHEWARAQVIKSLTLYKEDDDQRTSPLPDMKTILTPFLPHVRFLAMTPREFVLGPVTWNIFEGRDDFAILCNLVSPESVPLPGWVCKLSSER
ncbi:BTB/POZ domain-containing protein 1-like isoform X2 [Haemaphysalis longicornis]